MRALLLLLLAALPAQARDLQLHVPSPDWRDQVLYFVVTDRFDDGDPSNNDQGAGEFKPGSDAHYQGGDFAGLLRRLDYVQGLGATGVWITPPVLNQWWDGRAQYSGYHGYWAADFQSVDPHLGTLADYQRLSDALHRRGMTLVQDIVVNHVGNFFGYGPGRSARDPAAGWQANEQSRPMARPTQPPFDANDPRDPAQRRAGIYHWTGDVTDFGNRRQVLTGQMSGLDDLNTDNPVVRRALRASYGHWIRQVGVDAFRVDTAFYVPPAFFDDFLHARDAAAPGIQAVARSTGRHDFFSFGEGFVLDAPYQVRGTRQIEAYATAPGGRPRLQGMLNFPLYGQLAAVLARGAPTAELGHRITALMHEHRDPHRMPSFVDNHDVDRFLAGGSEAALKQALLALLTLPGIPVIYYGTEQGFTGQRAALFAAGAGSGGRDHFDTQAPLYRWLQGAIALRRTQPTLSRGRPVVLRADAAGPGVLAWRMDPEPGSTQPPLLVLLNSAERPALLDALLLAAAPGQALPLLYSIDGSTPAIATDARGTLTMELPARAGLVLQLPPSPTRPHATGTPSITLDPPRLSPDGATLQVRGRATPGRTLRLVLDGDSTRAPTTTADAQGRWQAALDTRALVDARVPHRVLAWDVADNTTSAAHTVRVTRAWQTLLDQADPAGDDHGPAGSGLQLAYPTHATWGANRQMDLRRVRVAAAGDALQIELQMPRITRSWNPPNGFDHVAFTVFIEAPGRDDGQRAMPLQGGDLPDGMRWHWRLRVHGWSNALYDSRGASATNEGTAVSPGAAIQVDSKRHTLRLTLPGGLLGQTDGARLYVTTWDYDGGYRDLQPTAGGHHMGGGPGPKVMDDFGPVSLRSPTPRR